MPKDHQIKSRRLTQQAWIGIPQGSSVVPEERTCCMSSVQSYKCGNPSIAGSGYCCGIHLVKPGLTIFSIACSSCCGVQGPRVDEILEAGLDGVITGVRTWTTIPFQWLSHSEAAARTWRVRGPNQIQNAIPSHFAQHPTPGTVHHPSCDACMSQRYKCL